MESKAQGMPSMMFKTAAGQARYFTAYEATLALCGVPVTGQMVNTRFGPTHVNACGPEDAPPLVLLHGAAVSSTIWYPNLAALSCDYRVYAPDIIGELGKSVCTQPKMKAHDYLDWLCDLFDGLHVEKAHVAGLSLGGYLAIMLARAAPQRVHRLILLSPATLLNIRPLFYLRIAAAVLAPFLSPSTRQTLVMGLNSSNAAPVIRQVLTPTDFRYRMFSPPASTDVELRQIQAAALLLLGEREIIYNPQKALARAKKLIPQLEVEIVPGAGHAVNLDQPEIVNRRMLAFLARAA